MKNLYEILEVSENASKDVIEKVYKVLAKKYHPDLQSLPSEKEKAEEKMKEINEAYYILSDEEKRKKYDLELANKRIIQENRTSNNNYYTNNTNIYKDPVKTYTNVTKNNTQNNEGNYENQKESETNSYGNSKLDKRMKKQQKRLEKQLKRKMEEAYLKAYGEYLTKNGYKVQYRMDYKKIPLLLAVIAVLIFIGWILWIIPITHDYLVQVYEENIIIKKIIDIFIKK